MKTENEIRQRLKDMEKMYKANSDKRCWDLTDSNQRLMKRIHGRMYKMAIRQLQWVLDEKVRISL